MSLPKFRPTARRKQPRQCFKNYWQRDSSLSSTGIRELCQRFALALDKGKSKLRPADASGGAGCQTSKLASPGVALYNVATCRNITMDGFAEALRGLASADITGPVANLTGLSGNWDLDLKWTDRRSLTSAISDITLFHAISEQLGLVLGRKPVRMPVLVVDHVDQRPTPNPPGTMALLPPPEFEVASIKPSAPGTRPGGGGFLPGGRVEFRATPLALLLLNAWDLNILPDQIPGAPKWLTPFEPSFDLFAKAPAGAIANGAQLYQGDYQMMLRALLVERFKIVSHYEDRPTNTYTLIAQKSKLRKADPSSRPGCKTARSWSSRPSESAPVLLEAVCRNITMSQFAQQLQSIAPLYFHYPVLDATGLMGSWDFSFTFSRIPPELLGGWRRRSQERRPGPTGCYRRGPVGPCWRYLPIQRDQKTTRTGTGGPETAPASFRRRSYRAESYGELKRSQRTLWVSFGKPARVSRKLRSAGQPEV